MKSGKLSRREATCVIGAGVAASAAIVGSTSPALATSWAKLAAPAGATGPAATGAAAISAERALADQLVAPLASGAKLGRWQIASVRSLDAGAVSVLITGESGAFQLDVVGRSASPHSPGVTEYFEVMVMNHGDGAKPTAEEQGLAAMALAEVIRGNEQMVDVGRFVSSENHQRQARSYLHELTEQG